MRKEKEFGKTVYPAESYWIGALNKWAIKHNTHSQDILTFISLVMTLVL